MLFLFLIIRTLKDYILLSFSNSAVSWIFLLKFFDFNIFNRNNFYTANCIANVSSAIVQYTSRMSYCWLFKSINKYIGKYKIQGTPRSKSFILNRNLNDKKNIFAAKTKQYFNFTLFKFLPVVIFIKYSVNSPVQRNVSKKLHCIKWHYFIIWWKFVCYNFF